MTENRWILSADIGEKNLQLSLCQNEQMQMKDGLFPLPEEETEKKEAAVMEHVWTFLQEQQFDHGKIEKVILSFEHPLPDQIKTMRDTFVEAGFSKEMIGVISRENAFVHYVIHQEPSLYEHTVLLFDFDGTNLFGYRLEHSKKKTPKQFRVEAGPIGSFQLLSSTQEKGRLYDEHFSSIARQLLSREVVSAVFLTGEGFSGGWLDRSLKVLCNGRRAFIGQNLFSGGGCYYALLQKEEKETDYMILAPETVFYESGVVDSGREEQFVPITKAGKAWYETKGSIEVIPERGKKVEIVFSNVMTKEKQVEAVDISRLGKRPRKTGRLHIEVEFLGSRNGLILVRDEGFGAFVPATHQVFLKEFQLL